VDDPKDLLHREPLVARFRVRGVPPDRAFTFNLVVIHTDPDETATELDALADVFVGVQRNGSGEDDVILLGDLNVDEYHLGRLGQLPNIGHAITGVMTNTRRDRMYDNVVFDRRATTEYTGRWGVVDLQKEFNLTQQAALEVSDHCPVWAEFSAYESGFAPRGGGTPRDREVKHTAGHVPAVLAWYNAPVLPQAAHTALPMSTAASLFVLLSITAAAEPYQSHGPIVVLNKPTSPDAPLIIEGYEIANPDGPGIQVRDVDYVIIRNNYVHDCGTNVSQRRQRLVQETGDARKAMLDKPFETGGILVFDAKGSVQVYGNRVRNNDYGIMVQGHRHRASNVSIHDNKVQDNHRAAFIWVGQADAVAIHGNQVQDNGLDVFFDNVGLEKAMQKGEDFGDGRAQGILAKDSNHVRIYGNTVINSASDGIGIMNRGLNFGEDHRLRFDPDDKKHLVHDIEIFDNVVERNGEQGLWITSARRGRIYRNKVIANAHRRGKTGGSSGVVLEGDVYEFEIADNEIAYNDIFGIAIISSSNNTIRGNHIHHNGDGGIGWTDAIHIQKRPSANNMIEGNDIHNNRVAAFVVRGLAPGKTVVKQNRTARNGGAPIHFQFYDDYDMRAHPQDWEVQKDDVLFGYASEDQFEMDGNATDRQVVGKPLEMDSSDEPNTRTILCLIAALALVLAAGAAAGLWTWSRRRASPR